MPIILLTIALNIFVLTQNVIGEEVQNNLLCGPNCLLAICNHFNIPASFDELIKITNTDKKTGTTMYDIFLASKKKGLKVEAVRTSLDKLCKQDVPCIVFVNNNHFSLFLKSTNKNIILQDPPNEPFVQTKEDFFKSWKGHALLYENNNFQNQDTINKKTKRQPIFFMNNTIYDFGEVNEFEKVSNIIKFQNTGNEILNITARSGCNCTEVNILKNSILPQNTGELKVTYSPIGKVGNQEEMIIVRTNDPCNQLVKVKFKFKVLKGIYCQPLHIYLDNVGNGEKISQEVKIISPLNKQLEIIDIKSDSLIVNSTLSKISEGDKTIFKLNLDMMIDKFVQKIDSKVTLITNDKYQKTVEIPIIGNIVNSIECFPPRIFFHSVKQNSLIEKEIKIYSNDNKKFRINKLTSNTVYIDMCVKSTADSLNYIISVIFKAPNEKCIIKDNLCISLSDIKNTKINIPFFAQIK